MRVQEYVTYACARVCYIGVCGGVYYIGVCKCMLYMRVQEYVQRYVWKSMLHICVEE
jgi:hypothetical protein